MLGLASRAMKSEAISRLIDEQLRENEKFRSHFLKALRTSYSISVLLLLLVVFIYGILSRLSRLPIHLHSSWAGVQLSSRPGLFCKC